uniref:G protein-coupled receptor 65 n=1 Tax=Sphaeramia orbicularis TaxID=375764 RepID=A0A673CAN9_9TELE
MHFHLITQTNTDNHSNNQLNSSCTEEEWMPIKVLPVFMWVITGLGIVLNILVVLVFSWMLMRNGSNMAVYLVSLSISDLLYIVSLPVWIELSLRRPVGCGLCSVTAVVMNNSFYVGSGLLCCISVDRYLAVVYPLHFHWVREVRTAAVVWALQAFSSSTLCMEKIPMSHETAHLALTRVILGFFVPFVIMSFCFQQIMYSLKRSTSIVAEERRKVGRLLLLLLLAYVVAFVPYQTVMLLRAVLEPRTDTSAFQLKAAYLVTVATTTLNSVLDPIIYCLISESAQGEIKKLIEKGRQVCSIVTIETPSSPTTLINH